MDDAGIVGLFYARNEAAITETAKKYGAKLSELAYRALGDKSAAEECLNDALLRAWEHIPPADPADHLFAYLAKTVRGLAIDRLRHDKSLTRGVVITELTHELSECVASNESVEDAALANELAGSINAFVKELPRDKQLVFIRRYWYFDSISDIAKSLGFSESKVKSDLSRMRKKLKSRLEGKGYSI